jgi:hypothetical protein
VISPDASAPTVTGSSRWQCHAAPAPDIDVVQGNGADPQLDFIIRRGCRVVDLNDP